jgi:hydroxyacylglutathione hydrolase
MGHVVTAPPKPFLGMGGALRVVALPAAQDNLVWVIECTATGQAAVVDGPDAAAALAWIEARGLTLVAVLNTHTHGDHVGLNKDLARRGLLEGLRVIGPAAAAVDVPGITEPVDEGDVIAIGALSATVIRTDGHLRGHVCYRFGDVLFCGDTLFTGGCGYVFDGTPAQMADSLARLVALPADTRVCCAHEYTQDNLRFAWTVEPSNPALAARIRVVWAARARGETVVPSTIGEERATNPFVRLDSPELLTHTRAAMPDLPLDNPTEVFAAVRGWKNAGLHRAVPDDALPLAGG